MSRIYEIDIIISLDKDQASAKETNQWAKDLITEHGGQILRTSDMGNKRLAYEIRKKKEGYIAVVYFEAEPSFIGEFERQLKLNRSVLRYMILNLEPSDAERLLGEEVVAEVIDDLEDDDYEDDEDDYDDED